MIVHSILTETSRIVGKGKQQCAASRFAKPRNSLKKVLIVAVRSCYLCVLIRGLQNLDAPCKGDVFTFFLRRAKRTKKHARGLRTSGLRGRFKSPVDTWFLLKCPANIRYPAAQKTGKFSGIAGNDLNRCDVPALQHKIRAKMKRTAVFFADSRLRGVEMGSGGWKRVALDSN